MYMHYDCSLRLNITDVYFRVCIRTSSCHDTGNECDMILERPALTYSYPVMVIQLITRDLHPLVSYSLSCSRSRQWRTIDREMYAVCQMAYTPSELAFRLNRRSLRGHAQVLACSTNIHLLEIS